MRASSATAAAVRDMRMLYTLGRQVPPKRPPGDAYDRGELRAAAAELKVSAELARQARQLVDPGAGYTPAELRELFALVRAARPARGGGAAVFGRTHLVLMLSVPKPQRGDVQRAAVGGGWSSKRLGAEIAARFGTRRGGGRRPRPPGDAAELLARFERMCEAWRRWQAAVDPPAAVRAGHATLADLPGGVRARAAAAGKAVRALQRAVAAELAKERPAREPRPEPCATPGPGR